MNIHVSAHPWSEPEVAIVISEPDSDDVRTLKFGPILTIFISEEQLDRLRAELLRVENEVKALAVAKRIVSGESTEAAA